MAPKPRPTPFCASGVGCDQIIWASNTTALARFFPSATPAGAATVTATSSAVAGHTRRQYPGDTSPVSVRGHNRQIFPDRPLASLATPGVRFWCEEPFDNPDGSRGKRRTQFTYQGSFKRIKEIARQNPGFDWVIRNGSGAAYNVTKPAGPPGGGGS